MPFWWCIYSDNSRLVALMLDVVAEWGSKSERTPAGWRKNEPCCCCCCLFILLHNVWQGNSHPRWVTEVEISQQTPRTQISHKTSKKTDYYAQGSLTGFAFLLQDVIYLQKAGIQFLQFLFFQRDKLTFVQHLYPSLISHLPDLCLGRSTFVSHQETPLH